MPTGQRLDNSFSTKISFPNNVNIALWEKEVGLPGPEGGEPIKTTTMRNLVYETQIPRILQTIKGATIKVAYDPQALLAIVSMINKLQLIVWTFPDSTTWSIWAWLRSFQPDPNSIDEKQPEANCMIEPAMQNASGVETGFAVGTRTSSTSTTTTTS